MKLSKSIVDENFRGLSDFIKDDDTLHWYKQLIEVCLEEYAARAINLALHEAAEFAQNQQLRDQPVYGRDIMLLEKSIIKKTKVRE